MRKVTLIQSLAILLGCSAIGLAILAAAPLSAQSPKATLAAQHAPSPAAIEAAAAKYFPGHEDAAPAKRLFRLTRRQLDATVAWLLPGYAPVPLAERMPRDPLQTNFEYAELLALNAANMAPLTGWIGEIAARVKAAPEKLVACPGSPPATDCLDRAARDFIAKALRGEITPERADRITTFFLNGVKSAGLGQAAGELVEVVLNSPAFLFRAELESDRRGRLSPAQLLQAITYTLADLPPGAMGYDVNDALAHVQTDDGAGLTIERVLGSPAAREKLVRFFHTWLEVREPAELPISREVFPELTPKLAAAMFEETDRFLRAKLAGPSPTLDDITQARTSFVSGALAPIYGAGSADPSGKAAVPLDPAQRLGIFSQAAVIASHSGPTNTRLVKRGAFWVRKVMCMELGPAPKDVHEDQYGTLETTERRRIEQATRPGPCMGCHKVMNPFSFMLENYDALGRWRTKDNGHPVDPAIVLDFLDEAPSRLATAVEAIATLTRSMMFKQCFVRQMFRFYMGRSEEPADDPTLRRMFLALARSERGGILPLVRTLALSDRLRRREL